MIVIYVYSAVMLHLPAIVLLASQTSSIQASKLTGTILNQKAKNLRLEAL